MEPLPRVVRQTLPIAVILAATVMLVFSGPISDFVHRHPTMKMLALAFLVLIGVVLGLAIKNVRAGLVIGLILGLLAGSLAGGKRG